MTLKRMDNVLIVVDDLEAVKAFFVELGMELEGETTVEGPSVDRLIGLQNVRATLAMLRTPDGHGRIELDKFHTPEAIRTGPENAPVNALGIRRIMFAVDDIDDVVARLLAHGAELVGEVVQYEDSVSALLRPRPRGHHRRACRAARVRRWTRCSRTSGSASEASVVPQGLLSSRFSLSPWALVFRRPSSPWPTRSCSAASPSVIRTAS